MSLSTTFKCNLHVLNNFIRVKFPIYIQNQLKHRKIESILDFKKSTKAVTV